MAHNLQITRIRKLDDLEKYRDTWTDLIETSKFYGPWLSFDWFQLWIRHFLGEAEPVILIVHNKNRVLAIAPFLLRSETNKIGFRIRKLELIGNQFSPLRSFIFSALAEKDIENILKNLIKYFLDEFTRWDVLQLEKLPQENSVFDLVKKILKKSGLQSRDYFCVGNWYLDGIDYGFDEYFQNLPKSLRKDIGYCERRMSRDGELHFEILKEPAKVQEYKKYYYQIRETSWKAPEKGKEFIIQFLNKCAEHRWLRLGFLFFNGQPIAAQRWLVFGNTAYIWDTLHNAAFNRYSPGKVLTAHILKSIMNETKIEQIDFMTGDEDYKKDWTPRRRERMGLTIFNNTARGYSLWVLVENFLPLVKRIKFLDTFRKKVVRR